MRSDLEQKLVKDFPLLYKGYKKQKSCMLFGFETDDGWYDLIYELSSKLEPMIQKYICEMTEKTCVCGELDTRHDDLTGQCFEIYQIPYQWKALNKWGHYSIACNIVDSKKLRNRLYVFYRRMRWTISRKINRILEKLCDYKILYKNKPSSCKQFQLEYPRAAQVKSKFAQLRLYLTHGTKEMYDLIHEYEEKSAKVCELCGKPSKIRNHKGWYIGLCDECETKYSKKGEIII